MDAEIFKDILLAYGKAVGFLTTTIPGLTIGGLALAGLFLFSVWQAARNRSLACAAAGQKLKAGESVAIVGQEIYRLLVGAFAALPALIAVVAIAGTLYAVSDSLARFDELRLNAERISQLTAVVRNLEKRQKVIDVHVASTANGQVSLQLEFFDPSQGDQAVGRQDLTLPGATIYFDALVCNFDYAEIAAGRRVNLAIPYRVFSDQVAQANGIALNLRDAEGVPYMYARSETDVYGIAPEAYHERLRELLQIMDDERSARLTGIVRSVYGSAVHRRVVPGERFSIWIEQSGGLVIKTPRDF